MANESPVEPTKIFVEGLPTLVKEAQVCEMFEAYGEIAELNLVRVQGQNLPFATIKYQTAAAATAAVEDCTDRRIKGYPVTVMPFVTDFAKRKGEKVDMLILTNLSPTVNSAQIREFFSQFAPVFTAKVMYSEFLRQLESRCFGHVQFMDHDGFDIALQAVKKLQHENQVLLESPNLKIRRRVPIRENLYVRGFDQTFTEDQLKEVFSQFGRIKSAKIQKSKNIEVPLGYGFVCFNQYGAAQRAIEGLDDQEVDGITWVVRPHQKGSDRRAKQTQEYRANISDRNSRKVLVCNLGDSISEEQVRKVFAEAGEIDDVYILRSEDCQHLNITLSNCPVVNQMKMAEGITEETKFELQQKNIGRKGGQPNTTVFVTYKTIEAADKAIETLHGKDINGIAIEVTKHAKGQAKSYNFHLTGRNQQLPVALYNLMSPLCIPFERLPPAHQKLIKDVNFPNDEEANASVNANLLLAAYYYHAVSVCEEELDMFARVVPFIMCSPEYKIERNGDYMMMRQELYSIGRDTDKIRSVAHEAYTQNLSSVPQFIIRYYGEELTFNLLRNLYIESKYRLMLGLSKDEFIKVWNALAKKLEVKRNNVAPFIQQCFQTKSFVEQLQSTKNEIDLSEEFPQPKFTEDP